MIKIIKKLNIFLLSVLALLFYSCELFDREEYIPAYVKVEEFKLITDPINEGSNSHSITDAWLYVNNEEIGVFEIPFTVPVLEEGEQRIRIEPGIKNNGVDAQRVIYPMMYDYSIDTVLTPEEIIKLKPEFRYRPNVIKIQENFEQLGNMFEVSPDSDTTFKIIDDERAIEGRSMAIYLDDNRRNFECRSSELFDLPQNYKVYLEIDYKNTDPFSFGFFSKEISGGDVIEKRVPVFTFNPNTNNEARKTYIELTYHLNQTPSYAEYRLYFLCSRPNDATSDKTEIIIDNIRILHF